MPVARALLNGDIGGSLERPEWNINGMSPEEGVENTLYATPLPKLLRDAGYYTIHVGKAHWASAGTPGASPYNMGYNVNVSGNMLRSKIYVCPVCGNVIHCMGDTPLSCCGITLPPLEAEAPDEAHGITIENVEDEHFITVHHPMTKEHFISFVAHVNSDRLQLVKLYPEGNPETRLQLRGRGYLYYYCNRHGMFKKKLSYTSCSAANTDLQGPRQSQGQSCLGVCPVCSDPQSRCHYSIAVGLSGTHRLAPRQ